MVSTSIGFAGYHAEACRQHEWRSANHGRCAWFADLTLAQQLLEAATKAPVVAEAGPAALAPFLENQMAITSLNIFLQRNPLDCHVRLHEDYGGVSNAIWEKATNMA